MVQCQCLKLDGYQCTRNGSTKKSQDNNFCWQHQNCQRVVSNKTAPSDLISNQRPVTVERDIPLNDSNSKFKAVFSGIRALDKIILLAVPDRDLGNLLQANNYFYSFYDYEPLWREKILKEFGVGWIKTYTGSDWRKYYRSLSRYAHIYKLPENVDWALFIEKKGYKLRYGDIVVQEDVRFIYDGQQLIKFEAKFRYKARTIPQSFYVLSDNHGIKFPLDYWKNLTPEVEILWLKTADFTFAPSRYVKIANIEEDDIDIDLVYTDFMVGDKKYTLEYGADREMGIDDTKYFDTILAKFEYIPIRLAGYGGYFPDRLYEYVTGVHLWMDPWLLEQTDPELY